MCSAKGMSEARKHSLFTNLFAPRLLPFSQVKQEAMDTHVYYPISLSFVALSFYEDGDYGVDHVPNQLAYFATLFKFEKFDFLGYITPF